MPPLSLRPNYRRAGFQPGLPRYGNDRRKNTELSTADGITCQFPPRAARYIRVTVTSNSANTGRHLVEVLAFEK